MLSALRLVSINTTSGIRSTSACVLHTCGCERSFCPLAAVDLSYNNAKLKSGTKKHTPTQILVILLFLDLSRGRFFLCFSVRFHFSDGLRTRLVFAEIALMRPHILLLDEPTNHASMEMIDSMARAIKQFQGGVIVISHDFRLLQQVCLCVCVVCVVCVAFVWLYLYDGCFS